MCDESPKSLSSAASASSSSTPSKLTNTNSMTPASSSSSPSALAPSLSGGPHAELLLAAIQASLPSDVLIPKHNTTPTTTATADGASPTANLTPPPLSTYDLSTIPREQLENFTRRMLELASLVVVSPAPPHHQTSTSTATVPAAPGSMPLSEGENGGTLPARLEPTSHETEIPDCEGGGGEVGDLEGGSRQSLPFAQLPPSGSLGSLTTALGDDDIDTDDTTTNPTAAQSQPSKQVISVYSPARHKETQTDPRYLDASSSAPGINNNNTNNPSAAMDPVNGGPYLRRPSRVAFQDLSIDGGATTAQPRRHSHMAVEYISMRSRRASGVTNASNFSPRPSIAQASPGRSPQDSCWDSVASWRPTANRRSTVISCLVEQDIVDSAGIRSVNGYVFDCLLGTGAHGSVYRVVLETDGSQVFAMKVMNRKNGMDRTPLIHQQSPPPPNPTTLPQPSALRLDPDGSPTNATFINNPKHNSPTHHTNSLAGRSLTTAPVTTTALQQPQQQQQQQRRPRTDEEQRNDRRLKAEIAVMKKLNHRNIVKLHEVMEDVHSGTLFLRMEYVNGREILTPRQGGYYDPISEVEAARYIRQLAGALCYIHRCGVVHRDIKPSNLLLDTKAQRVYVADFGVSDIIDENTDSGLMKGTPAFFAPELLLSRQQPRNNHSTTNDDSTLSPAIDLWATGVTLYCMLFGIHPFVDPREIVPKRETIERRILLAEYSLPTGMCSEACCRTLRGLLDPNPTTRWTAEDLRKCDFVKRNLQHDQIVVAVPKKNEGERRRSAASPLPLAPSTTTSSKSPSPSKKESPVGVKNSTTPSSVTPTTKESDEQHHHDHDCDDDDEGETVNIASLLPREEEIDDAVNPVIRHSALVPCASPGAQPYEEGSSFAKGESPLHFGISPPIPSIAAAATKQQRDGCSPEDVNSALVTRDLVEASHTVTPSSLDVRAPANESLVFQPHTPDRDETVNIRNNFTKPFIRGGESVALLDSPPPVGLPQPPLSPAVRGSRAVRAALEMRNDGGDSSGTASSRPSPQMGYCTPTTTNLRSPVSSPHEKYLVMATDNSLGGSAQKAKHATGHSTSSSTQ